MKIAVIIPYYPSGNTDELYTRCLDSVSPQFEVYDLIDFKHEGVSAMRNKGLDYIFKAYPDTDYITFLDADDTYAPNAYEQMCEAINESPDEGIIQLNHVREYPDGRTQLRLPSKRGTYDLSRMPNLWVSSCNKLFKAELIRDIRFVEGLSHGEDELFVLNCLAKTRRMYVSDRIALHYHKDNPDSLSTRTSLDDILGEQRALLDFLATHKSDKEICELVRTRQAELWNNACYKRVFGGTE